MLWVVGDVQGFAEPLRRVLRQAGLIDAANAWSGGDATLAVLGDLVDRGPDGVGVIELLMRLQTEAPASNGRVVVVVGNHDILLLAASHFGLTPTTSPAGSFLDEWRRDGGSASDLERLTAHQSRWLAQLPALWLEQDVLLAHADSLLYLEYGSSIDTVNARVRDVLSGRDVEAWGRLLDAFSEHRAFSGDGGCERLDRVLGIYGGTRLVHGHTPVARLARQAPESVLGPYVYCSGRCIDVDPGMYLGGPGFCYALSRPRLTNANST